MSVLDGRTQAEIACALGVPEGTVASWLSRTKARLRSELERLLAELGYRVTWQVEDRDAGTSMLAPTAPADGYIIEGVLRGRDMTLVVERGVGVTPAVSACAVD